MITILHYRATKRKQSIPAPLHNPDPIQKERDWFWNELLRECSGEKHVRTTRVAWLLDLSGRSQSELYAALDAIYAEQADADAEQANLDAALAATPVKSTLATSPAANPKPVFIEKETKMTEQEKQTVKSEWNTKMQAMADAHPLWSTAAVLSQVARENPELREKYVAAANTR